MKKIVSLITALALSCIVLASCGAKETKQPKLKELSEAAATLADVLESQVADFSEKIENLTDKTTPLNTETDIEAETKPDSENDNTLELGKAIVLGDIEMTLTAFSVVKDYQDKSVLKITYDWKNNGSETTSPFLSFTLKGFQNGVETDSMVIFSDSIDLGSGQKEVKPGAAITGAETGIAISDMNEPLLLELSELFSFDDKVFSMTIDNLAAY